MVGIFKTNNPLNAFLLFIYGLALKFAFLSHSVIPTPAKTDGLLYHELLLGLQAVASDMPMIYSIITYLLLFTQAISFNKILNEQRLVQRSTYLPAMSYLLMSSIIPEWNMLSSALITNTLLIWIWLKINSLYNTSNPKTNLFNIGLLTGISALIYFPSIGITLLIVFALILIRPFDPAEWAIALAGIVTPFYYLFAWLFLSGNLRFYKFPTAGIAYPVLQESYWQLAALIIVLMAFLTGIYFIQGNFTKQVVQIRKSWSLLHIYLVISILIPFINDTHSFKNWIITIMPLSAFIACGFLYPPKKWFPLLLHWIMAGLVMVISYYHK